VKVRDEMLKIKDQDPETAPPPTCVRCKQPYRIKVQYRFQLAWRQLLSIASVTNFMQGVFLTLIVFAMVYLAFLINRGPPEKLATDEANPDEYRTPRGEPTTFTDKVVVDICTVLMVLMAGFTLYKVKQRWQVANSIKDVEVDV